MRIENFKIYNDGTSYNCGDINLIIGPNNCGKTTFLNELHGSLSSLSREGSKIIANFDISFDAIKSQEYWRAFFPKVYDAKNFDSVRTPIEAGSTHGLNIIKDAWNNDVFNAIKDPSSIPQRMHIADNQHRQQSLQGQRDLMNFFKAFLVAYEGIEDRFQESFEIDVNDIFSAYDNANSPLMSLRNNDAEFKVFQKTIEDVFGFYVNFDDLMQGKKRLYISEDQNFQETIPGNQHSSERAIYYEQNLARLNMQGHGIRAFAKIVLSLFTSRTKLVFIDEPETFIHPPQRRALARAICAIAKAQDKQLFISSHDAEFLRGILSGASESKLDTQVYYLRRSGDKMSLKHVTPDQITQIKKQSKARIFSERLINGLFYKRIILVENEADRAYYELSSKIIDDSAAEDVCFVGLSGASDVMNQRQQIIDLFGAEVHAIVDFDILVTPPNSFEQLPEPISSLIKELNEMLNRLLSEGKINKKDLCRNGRNELEQKGLHDDLSFLDKGISDLHAQGIHVVLNGALESFFEPDNRDKTTDSFSNEMNALALGDKNADLLQHLTKFMQAVIQ